MTRTTQHVALEILVLSAQGGNRKSLAKLLEYSQPGLLRHIARLIWPDNAAQDIWQDAVIAAMKGLRTLEDPAKFRPWLYRIATNKCRDWQRRQSRERRSNEELIESANLMEQAEDSNVTDSVLQTLRSMDGEQRQILALFYREGLSINELALAMDITPGAVKTRLFRARKQFRIHWEGENDE